MPGRSMRDRFSPIRETIGDVVQFLDVVLPKEQVEARKIGVAGGFALASYQLRFLSNTLPNECNPEFNDVDVFICGEAGATENSFNAIVRNMIQKAEDNYYEIEKEYKYRNHYVYADRAVSVTNIRVVGIEPIISFVQCCKDSEVEVAIERFDISFVQVIYDNHANNFRATATVRQHIETRRGNVKTFWFQACAPSDFEIVKLKQTLFRISKYASRGFTFDAWPKLKMFPCREQGRLLLSPDMFPEDQEKVPDRIVKRDSTQAIRYLKEMLPGDLMRGGIVGLVGELPLYFYLNRKDLGVMRPNDRLQKHWMIEEALVLVCGNTARNDALFDSFINDMQTHLSRRQLVVYTWTCDDVNAGTGKIERKVYFSVKDIGMHIVFQRCPDKNNVTEALGDIWFQMQQLTFNFDWERPVAENVITSDISSGITSVGNFKFEGYDTNIMAFKDAEKKLKQMKMWYRRGWEFRGYPKLITDANADRLAQNRSLEDE